MYKCVDMRCAFTQNYISYFSPFFFFFFSLQTFASGCVVRLFNYNSLHCSQNIQSLGTLDSNVHSLTSTHSFVLILSNVIMNFKFGGISSSLPSFFFLFFLQKFFLLAFFPLFFFYFSFLFLQMQFCLSLHFTFFSFFLFFSFPPFFSPFRESGSSLHKIFC